MNIIYELNNNDLRMLNFDDSKTYCLTELKIFISKQYSNYHFYCLIKDTEQIDLIQLTQIGTNKGYNIYSISMKGGPAAHCQGPTTFSLVTNKDGEMLISDSFLINLDFTNYNFVRQINAISAISEDIANKYARIEEMTKMNLSLYKDMQEVK